jgi:hypothetical protein
MGVVVHDQDFAREEDVVAHGDVECAVEQSPVADVRP